MFRCLRFRSLIALIQQEEDSGAKKDYDGQGQQYPLKTGFGGCGFRFYRSLRRGRSRTGAGLDFAQDGGDVVVPLRIFCGAPKGLAAAYQGLFVRGYDVFKIIAGEVAAFAVRGLPVAKDTAKAVAAKQDNIAVVNIEITGFRLYFLGVIAQAAGNDITLWMLKGRTSGRPSAPAPGHRNGPLTAAECRLQGCTCRHGCRRTS